MISLAIADDTAIFQPWFFKRNASERRTRIGVSRCEEGKPIISWLESHFISIWDKQSVSLDDFQNNHARGTDCAVQYLDITNMYLAKHPDIDGTRRMLAILKNTKEYLYVKQVSLRHLLTDFDLKKEFEEVLKKRTVTVRLLFIDVDSEVAMMRSYGEYIQGCELNNQLPEVKTYEEFRTFKDNQGGLLRHHQPLCRDTRDAIKIANILKNTYTNLRIKTYYAAPDAAIIVNEHSALFESLHYGAKKPRKTANYMTILSGEMPLMEFKKDEDKGGQVYDVVKSNFNFVWEHLSQDVKNSGGIS